MKSCWTILGIERGSDARTVKRAYAGLLKRSKPDEDADGFQTLRAAYTEALEELQREEVAEDVSATYANAQQTSRDQTRASEFGKADTKWELRPEEGQILGQVNDRLEKLLSDPRLLFHPEAWEFVHNLALTASENLRTRVSALILKQFAAHNRQNKSSRKKRNRIDRHIVSELNGSLHWTIEPERYLRWVDEGDIIEVLRLTRFAGFEPEADAVGGLRRDDKRQAQKLRKALSVARVAIFILMLGGLAWVGMNAYRSAENQEIANQYIGQLNEIFGKLSAEPTLGTPARDDVGWKSLFATGANWTDPELTELSALSKEIAAALESFSDNRKATDVNQKSMDDLLPPIPELLARGGRRANIAHELDVFSMFAKGDKRKLDSMLKDMSTSIDSLVRSRESMLGSVRSEIQKSRITESSKVLLTKRWNEFIEVTHREDNEFVRTKRRYLIAYENYVKYIEQNLLSELRGNRPYDPVELAWRGRMYALRTAIEY